MNCSPFLRCVAYSWPAISIKKLEGVFRPGGGRDCVEVRWGVLKNGFFSQEKLNGRQRGAVAKLLKPCMKLIFYKGNSPPKGSGTPTGVTLSEANIRFQVCRTSFFHVRPDVIASKSVWPASAAFRYRYVLAVRPRSRSRVPPTPLSPPAGLSSELIGSARLSFKLRFWKLCKPKGHCLSDISFSVYSLQIIWDNKYKQLLTVNLS